jgi:hypothetical protein
LITSSHERVIDRQVVRAATHAIGAPEKTRVLSIPRAPKRNINVTITVV